MKIKLFLFCLLCTFSTNYLTAQQNNLAINKLPVKIIERTSSDTLTIVYSYNDADKISHIDIKSTDKESASIDLVYTKDKLVCNYILNTISEKKSDIFTLKDNQITTDKDFNYLYKEGRLVEMKSKSAIGNNYSIQYDENGNVVMLYRDILPLVRGEDTVFQDYVYTYYPELKNKFFFTTSWFICDLPWGIDNYYELPTMPFFGTTSTNLVRFVKNGIGDTYTYKYNTFDTDGYLKQYSILNSQNETIVDYQIFYNDDIVLSNKNGKWGYTGYKNKVIIPFEYDNKFAYADTMLVSKNGKWCFIGKNNQALTSLNLDTTVYKVLNYVQKTIICKNNGTKVIFDLNGKVLGIILDDGKIIKSICDAINNGNIEAIKYFLSTNIDLNIKHVYHEKNAWNEFEGKEYPIAKLLVSSNKEILANMPELFSLFIKNGVDVNAGYMSITIIEYIIQSAANTDDKIKMMQIFLDNKGDINIKDGDQYTALRMVAYNKKSYSTTSCEDATRLTKFLLENGADPEIQAKDGLTALKVAKMTECKEFIKLLKTYKK